MSQSGRDRRQRVGILFLLSSKSIQISSHYRFIHFIVLLGSGQDRGNDGNVHFMQHIKHPILF